MNSSNEKKAPAGRHGAEKTEQLKSTLASKVRAVKHHPGVQIGVDCTDHVSFFCDTCGRPLIVTDVETSYIVVDGNSGQRDNCTWIRFWCPSHGVSKSRKFYWSTDDASNARYRTQPIDRE